MILRHVARKKRITFYLHVACSPNLMILILGGGITIFTKPVDPVMKGGGGVLRFSAYYLIYMWSLPMSLSSENSERLLKINFLYIYICKNKNNCLFTKSISLPWLPSCNTNWLIGAYVATGTRACVCFRSKFLSLLVDGVRLSRIFRPAVLK